MNVIRGPYLEDLLAQPAALQATIASFGESNAALTKIAQRSFDRIVLTGMGSSLSACHPLMLRFVHHGRAAMIVDTSELVHGLKSLLTKDTLVIAVSQSGRSAETVRLVEQENRSFALVGVTNTPGSPLATHADALVLTHAGSETTVSCKTYVATLAALTHLGDVLFSERTSLAALPETMKHYLDGWRGHVADLGPLFDGVRDVFFAGRGASLAAAYTAGLIVKESTRLHAEGMTSAALRHGPMEMSAPHVFALVYEGDPAVAPLNHALVADLERAGMRARIAGPTATVAALRLPTDPVLDILPAQMISIVLAAHVGIEAGRFLHATKITATE